MEIVCGSLIWWFSLMGVDQKDKNIDMIQVQHNYNVHFKINKTKPHDHMTLYRNSSSKIYDSQMVSLTPKPTYPQI